MESHLKREIREIRSAEFLLISYIDHHIILSTQFVVAMLWSTSKRPASDGGRYSGQQLLMMWSAVCSGSPHSHAALSASPHFFIDDP